MITATDVLEACKEQGIDITLADTVTIARIVNNGTDFLNIVHEEIINTTVGYKEGKYNDKRRNIL